MSSMTVTTLAGGAAAPALRIYGAAEIRAALGVDDVLEPVAAAFAAYSRGEGESPVAVLHPSPHGPEAGDAHVKSATLRGRPVFTVKVATWFAAKLARGKPPSGGVILVFDAQTGDALALLRDEHYLSDVRTAAAGAVAARALAPIGIHTAAVLGTGVQAELQALALARVRPYHELFIWGRDPLHAAALAGRLAPRLPGVHVRITERVQHAVERTDVLVTATASREPLVRGEWLRPGQHVTAVGADDTTKCELDALCLRRADRLIVDSCAEAVLHGDIYRAISRGDLAPDAIDGELGEVLAGTVAGRRAPSDITVVKLIGLGVQDLAAAEIALARLAARESAPRIAQ